MDNSIAGPSNYGVTEDVKSEFILGDPGETTDPTSASVDTSDLNSILDHLKVEEPQSEVGVIKNLVSFVEPTSVDKVVTVKQETQENELVAIKEELITDDEIDFKDLNVENCDPLKICLKDEKDDNIDLAGSSEEPPPDFKMQHKDARRKQNKKKRLNSPNCGPSPASCEINQSCQSSIKAPQNFEHQDENSELRGLCCLEHTKYKCEFCGINLLTVRQLQQQSLSNEGKLCSTNNIEQITETEQSKDENDSNGQNGSCFDDDSYKLSTENSDQTNKTLLAAQKENNLIPKNYHTGDIFCQCYDCDNDFKTIGSKKGTQSNESSTKPRPICEICKQSFYRKTALEKHIKTKHEGKRHICNICCRAFNSAYFQIHMKTQHSFVNKTHNCHKCDKSFTSEKNLNYHLLCHNNAVKLSSGLNPCEICGKNFTLKKNLKRHKKATHFNEGEKLICAHCDSKFESKSSIRSHMIRMHLPPTVKCNICDLLFSSATVLKKHCLLQHKIGQVQLVVCEICGKSFKRKSKLVYHMITSHPVADKKFKCQHCDKSFYVNQLLKQHSLVHSDIRNFKCGLCDKGFKLKHHLKQHMAVHGLESIRDYRQNLYNQPRIS